MPRNASNIYSKPPGTTPIVNDDVDPVPFNLLMDDIATDLNTPRPVVAGGTGASSAAAALVNFGLTATAAEINTLDGITASTAELNILDGVTATTAEINTLDGLTSSLLSNGYAMFPGGLILQWGGVTAGESGTLVTFPLTFPTGALRALVVADSATDDNATFQSLNSTSMTVRCFPNTRTVHYFAVGH